MADLAQFDKAFDLTLPIILKDGKANGELKISSTLVYEEPDPEKVERDDGLKPLNKKCFIELNIMEATFLEDSDFFGKQDPFIKFKYRDQFYQTTVKDDAGKHAVWKEKFKLIGID